jgi:hypothetical protein
MENQASSMITGIDLQIGVLPESQLNSPLGAHILSHFIVKELGKDWSFRGVLFLELEQNMRL